MSKNQIYPLAVMTSLEPVCFRADSDFVDENFAKYKKDTTFSLIFTGFKDFFGSYHFSFMLENLEANEPPAFLSAIFDSFSKSAKKFVNYPDKIFKPYKRAILSFDEKAYSVREFQRAIKEWKKDIEGLEEFSD